jgi:methylglutaconyl-CoA hydratase
MKYLNVEEESNWIHITLNRPDVRNAFNPEMISEITEIFTQLSRHETARGIILKGSGKSFCAGADLSWMKEMVNYIYEQNQSDSGKLWDMFDSILHCSLPVIGLVHGAVFGGALGLLSCCDIVVADDKTQFCFSEVKLGISPAVISAFVTKKLSLGKVMPFMLTGQVFTAAEAIDMGLIHKKVTDEQFADELNKYKFSIGECGPEAIRATKELILSLSDLSWLQKKDSTTRVIAELRIGNEGQEGLRAFLEKRTPTWRSNNA